MVIRLRFPCALFEQIFWNLLIAYFVILNIYIYIYTTFAQQVCTQSLTSPDTHNHPINAPFNLLRTEDINLQQFIQYSSRIHGTEVVHILRIGETELARRGFPRGRRTFPSKLDGKRASKVHSMTGRPRCHGNGPPQTKSTPSGGLRDGPRPRKEFPSSWRKPSLPFFPPSPPSHSVKDTGRCEFRFRPLPAPGSIFEGLVPGNSGSPRWKLWPQPPRNIYELRFRDRSASVKMLGGMFQVLGSGAPAEGDLIVVKGEKAVALEVLNWNCYVTG